MANSNPARKIYNTVVDDVINGVKEAFLDEGVDEQVLLELKQLWENKLNQSRALDPMTPEPEQVIPATVQFAQLVPPQMTTHQPQHQPQQHQQQHQGAKTTWVKGAASQQGVPVNQQQTIQVPFHLQGGAELSGAAAMALNAQGGIIQQQLQSLIQAGHQVTLQVQQAPNGQVIFQAVPQAQAQAGQPTMTIPQQQAVISTQQMSSQQQQQVVQHTHHMTQATLQPHPGIPQLDGNHDTSSSEDDFDNDDDDNENDDENNEDGDEQGKEEEPLNSDDDVSEEDPTELFDTDNVVVCQFEKVSRNKNKWKFHLKDGIMNLNGRDYVFQKGTGEADW